MIAVWLVGPPSVVARATTSFGSRLAVSAGARSSAHRIEGISGSGTPGSGQAAEFGDHTVADVLEIGDAFGHQPTELSEHGDELLDGLHHRVHRRCAVLDALLGGPQPGAVLRQRGGGGENLRCRAGRMRGAIP